MAGEEAGERELSRRRKQAVFYGILVVDVQFYSTGLECDFIFGHSTSGFAGSGELVFVLGWDCDDYIDHLECVSSAQTSRSKWKPSLRTCRCTVVHSAISIH